MDGRIEIARGGDRPRRRALGDFSTDRRVLTLAGLAIITGSAASATAWVLLTLIGLVTNLVWYGRFDASLTSLAGATPGPWTVAIPVIGALIVGAMARYGSEKIRGHGIPEAMEAILIGGSRMSPKVAVLKPLSSAVAIGTGGPFGAEGPIIVTGGAVGSLFAQFFHLSAAERKTLLVAGAAAGMTAIFGTPVAAVLLAVEVLLFEWRPRSLVPVTVGAVTATLLAAAAVRRRPALSLRRQSVAAVVGAACLRGTRHRLRADFRPPHPHALCPGGRLRPAASALDVVAGAGRPSWSASAVSWSPGRSASATTSSTTCSPGTCWPVPS